MTSTLSPQLKAGSANKDRLPADLGSRKSQSKTLTFVLIAVIALLGVVGSARIFMKPPAPKTITVVAAAQDIPPGCRISFSNLHYIQIPSKYSTTAMYSSYEGLIGHYSRSFIPAREPITKSAMLPGTLGMAEQIGAQQRALTLKLSSESMVDYAIHPGDRVDVLATTLKDGKKYTRTICQNLLVLLATPKEFMLSDRSKQQDQDKITLAASPADAEKLTQAGESSKLKLTLRSSFNTSLAETPLSGTDDRDLLPHFALVEKAPAAPVVTALAAPPAPPMAFPPTPPMSMPMPSVEEAISRPFQWVVQVFKGSNKEEQSFDIK